MRNTEYIAFYNKKTNKRLGAITAEHIFEDEVEQTIGLLAYENKINPSDIEKRTEFK